MAERTNEYEVGLDASLYNGRVSYQFTGFRRNTTDGIFFNPLRPSAGIVEDIPRNVGRWWTMGLETALDVNVIDQRDLRVNVNVGYQWQKNEVTAIGLDGFGGGDNQISTSFGFDQRVRVGYPFPGLFGFPVINPDFAGAPIRSDTLTFLGVTIPPQQLSIGVSTTFRNRLTLEVFGTGQFGHVLIDEQAEELATDGVWPQCVGVDDTITEWLDGGSLGTLTAFDIAQCSSRNSLMGVDLNDENEDWAFDGDYFRISTVSLAYRIPEDWLPTAFQAATIQFRANNLHIFTDFPTGLDPDAILDAANEDLRRVGGYSVSLPRTYTLNLRVNF